MQKISDGSETKQFLQQIIKDHLTREAFDWLSGKLQDIQEHFSPEQFGAVFTAISRKAGKTIITLGKAEQETLTSLRNGFSPGGWTATRFCRVWWLLHLPAAEEKAYVESVTGLFRNADLEEQVALYSALPLLSYPQKFAQRASEGVRNSMGALFEAVALNNPYPSEYLAEPAWNQLVLKAFFMDKPVNRIIGLEERANKNLALILSDYAHERWSAKRPVNPQLWRPVGKFIDERIIGDIRRLFASGDASEMEAAALACSQSDYPGAKELLKEQLPLKTRIEAGELSWKSLTAER